MTTPAEPFSTPPDIDLSSARSEDFSSGDGAQGSQATAQRQASHVKDSAMSEAQDVAQTTKAISESGGGVGVASGSLRGKGSGGGRDD